MTEKITFKKFAELVLEDAKKPLSPLEIWDTGKQLGLSNNVKTSGRTPELTIGSNIYTDIRDNPKSLFYQYNSRPAKFYLSKFKEDFKPEEAPAEEFSEEDTLKTKYCERDLHTLLVKFVDSSLDFNAHVKTVYHEIAKRDQKGLNKWIYPDLVGVHLPFNDFDVSTLTIQKELFWTAVRFFSFEMKKELNIGTLRQCYFQAVSNSSWANEGYLVTLKIKDEDGSLMSELRRMNNAFGIGVIKLNVENINESEILIPAKKQELDWNTIEILLKKNDDFKGFMEIVKGDITLGRIANKNNYDEVMSDEAFEKYVLDKKISSP